MWEQSRELNVEQRVLTLITGVFLSLALPIAAAARIIARIEMMRKTMLAPRTMVLSEKQLD